MAKIKQTLYELYKGKNAYITKKQKEEIKKGSSRKTTGSKQTKEMMKNLSYSDYNEIQKKFGKKKK